MNYKLMYCWIFIFSILSEVSKAQNKFNAVITFPLSINLTKITIEYHNGFKISPVPVDSTKHILKISGFYFSKYPELIISYSDNSNTYQKKYFLERNAAITYYNNSKNNLDSAKLIHAFDVMDMGEKKFNVFAKNELKAVKSFLSVNMKYINDSELVYNQFIELSAAIQTKKLQFIKNNNNQFYSLWTFREEFVSNTNYKPENLLNIYNKYLAATFSNTFEAKQIINVLAGRVNSFEGKIAPLFSSTDIKGNTINLLNFREKKYVLLNFWATWCGPCVAEIPTIDSIYKQYTNKDITIISISEDRNEKKCLSAIEKMQMNWINIINDPMIEAVYGNNPALPQVFLIDKTGKIIYSRTEKRDPDLKKLVAILESLPIEKQM